MEENKALSSKLEADQQMKLSVKFSVKDKQKPTTSLEPQQAFLRFAHVKSGREIVFLAQANSAGLFNADIDFALQAKNFQQTSGLYSLELIVTDALIENPIRWKLGEINLQLISDNTENVEDKTKLYAQKPEIKHIFRVPEATPPALVSTVFSGLCLAPLALLLILVNRILTLCTRNNQIKLF